MTLWFRYTSGNESSHINFSLSPLELQEELIALLCGSSWSLGLSLLGGASLPQTMDGMDVRHTMGSSIKVDKNGVKLHDQSVKSLVSR